MKGKMKTPKKIIALFLSVILMLTSVPIISFAAEFQISGGTESTDYTYSDNTVTVLTETPLTLSGDITNTQIVVSSNANLTFSDYNSTVNNGGFNSSLLTVGENLDVKITLSGSNILKGNQDAANSPVTVTIPDTSTVTFTGDGSIEITGTSNYNRAGTAVSGGNITVDGADVTLKGGIYVSGDAATSVAFTGKSLTLKSGSLSTQTSVKTEYSVTYPDAETINYYGGSLNLGTVVIDDSNINTLTLEEGQTLALYGDCSAAESVSITNNGTINNYANLTYYNGTFSGNAVENKENGTITVNKRPHSFDDNGICTNTEGETHYQPAVYNETDNVYEISNAGQLAWFACLVNGDTSQDGITAATASANGKLMKDIDLSSVCSETLGNWTPIGEYVNKTYSGSFDGNGKTVTNLYINDYAYDGLFGYNGGTIKNITVGGFVSCEGYCGGICGKNTGKIFTSTYIGLATSTTSCCGGICGLNDGAVENCSNVGGTVKGGSYGGGICGRNRGTVANCFSTASVSGSGANAAASINGINSKSNGKGTVTNCYYLDTQAVDKNATPKTEEQFKSGEVAYLLNSEVTDGTQAWYQNIDNGETADDYPVFSGGTVYYGYKSCNASDKIYTNSKPVSATGHEYDENGICTKTEGETHYQPAVYNETDSVYEISIAGQLAWFACLVNGDTSQEGVTEKDRYAKGKLMNDIDMQYICSETLGSWPTIGYSNNLYNGYSGTFDGNGKEVSNLYVKNTFAALFANNNGTIKNLTVSGTSVSANMAAGVCVYNLGVLKNCINKVNVVSKFTAGGIAGANCFGGTIINCANFGTVTATDSKYGSAGGIARGNEESSIIKNCYNYGTVTGSKYYGSICGWQQATVTNCYYLDTTVKDSNATAKTADEFKSGEVAYLLNNKVTDGTQAWYQNIDNGKTADDYPVFSGGTVYYGYKNCTASDMIYTNSKASDMAGHSYDENGICTKTEGETHYQPAVYNETDNVYEISNSGQLAWFAALVNGNTSHEGITAANTSANGKLMNDIDLQYVCSETLGSWTPIGNSSKQYTGTFDGGSFEIKDIYINNTSNNQALFGYIKGATIKNTTVSGSITAGSRVAGICAQGYGGTITNCQNNCSVSGVGDVAGILARNGERQAKGNCTVTICANTGKITGSGDNVGGICGYSVGAIDYCYNLGDVSGNNRVGGICGNYNTGEIGSCYNMGNISGSNNVFSIAYSNVWYYTPLNCYHLQGTGNGKSSTAKTAEQFKSGEVCYLLGHNDIWRQTLGTDDYPVFSGEKVYRLTLTDYSGTNSDVNFYINLGNAITTPDAYASGYSFKSSDTLYESLGDITISGDTTITAIPAPAYTVTIPADVSIEEADKSDGVYTVSGADVSAQSKWLYANGKMLAISAASANDFELKVNGRGTGIPYTYTLGGSVVTQNSEILKFALTDDKQASLSGSISVNESDVKYSGNFTDTLTFTVSLQDAPDPIKVSNTDELMDAVNNSSLDTKIVLTSDIDLPAGEYDLKGHTISSSGGRHSISVYNVSEAVTLKNAKIIDSDSYKCCLYIYRAADVTLENISLITSYKYPLQITNSQTVTINNCYFKSSDNYGIFSNSDNVHLNLTITDSTLIGSENGLFVYSNSNYAKVTLQDEVVFDASDDNFYFGRSTLTVGKGYTEV